MRYPNWRMVSAFGLILGGLSLAGGFFAYFQYARASGSAILIFPYREFAVPLFVLGIVFLVIGFVTGPQGKGGSPITERKTINEFGYCPGCGAKRDNRTARYCRYCGRKFP